MLGKVISLGNVSVGFFFVLSGFIIAHVYTADAIAVAGGKLRFFLARFARIYPVYLLSISLDVPRLLWFRAAKYGTTAAIEYTGLTFILQAAMLQAWIPLGALNFPSWSLSTESFFYAIYPLVLPYCIKVASRAPLLLCLACCWFGSQLAPVFVSLLATPSDVAIGLLSFNPILRLPEFLGGVFLSPHLRGIAGSYIRLFRLGAIAAGCAALFVFVVWNANMIPPLMIENGLLLPCFAGLIWILVNTHERRSILDHRAFFFLGEASYCVYLLHIPVFQAMAQIAKTPAGYVLYLLTLIAVSCAVFWAVERPTRRWILVHGLPKFSRWNRS